MIRVLLVDDEPVVRRGLRARLRLESDIQVVGEASGGTEALSLAQSLLPDVVLLDVQMPDLDGIAVTEALLGLVPRCVVVMLSIHDDEARRARAQTAGAVAFVEKRGDLDALLAAIRQAAGRVGMSGA